MKAKPVNEIFKVNGLGDITRLIQFISGILTRSPNLFVKITDKEEQRSHAQNRLYWKWLKQYGDFAGLTDDEAHLFFKKEFLIKMYARDDEEFNATCQVIKQLKNSEHEQWETIAKHVLKETSTRDATVTQFTEYLSRIDQFCLEKGLRLDTPSDLMFALEQPKSNLKIMERVA